MFLALRAVSWQAWLSLAGCFLNVKVGRKLEAKDAARCALRSPWWTLGSSYADVASIAGWGEEQIEFMRERVSEEGRREDLLKGKDLAQVCSHSLKLG